MSIFSIFFPNPKREISKRENKRSVKDLEQLNSSNINKNTNTGFLTDLIEPTFVPVLLVYVY